MHIHTLSNYINFESHYRVYTSTANAKASLFNSLRVFKASHVLYSFKLFI